ncbi:uncharacterized protein LOC119550075 [Drosophila subpulchrella]|uniref:uncharacterized protein LOC119550075 n=1 Tax=Drosophila subpulchrella TaxID=1486046 RepID=UPI0018A13601|nr:uncharacterized protein LOC119550075 [Drosophila subpulchrella]
MERSRRVHQMVSQSFLSRTTVTESMAKMAILKVDSSETVENKVIKTLMMIEEMFRTYFASYQKELELQRIAAQSINQHIHRYRVTTQEGMSCMCPQIYEVESEDAMVTKYSLDYQVIVSSNKSQCWDIHRLRPFVLLFRRECAKLDLKEESPFILGDAFHKPIKFYMDLVEELFSYFYSGHLELDSAARLLSPWDLDSVEYYQKLLAPNEDFDEYFMHNISFCDCLRVPPKCQLNESSDLLVIKDRSEPFINEAKEKRCARRFAKMAESRRSTNESDQNKFTLNFAEESDMEQRSRLSHQTRDPRLLASEIDRFLRCSAENNSVVFGSPIVPPN